MDAFIQGALLLSTPENIGLISAGVLVLYTIFELIGIFGSGLLNFFICFRMVTDNHYFSSMHIHLQPLLYILLHPHILYILHVY